MSLALDILVWSVVTVCWIASLFVAYAIWNDR